MIFWAHADQKGNCLRHVTHHVMSRHVMSRISEAWGDATPAGIGNEPVSIMAQKLKGLQIRNWLFIPQFEYDFFCIVPSASC